MGRINSVKRRPLASSVVGTPGVDQTTALALQSLASNTSSIGRQLQQREHQLNILESTKSTQEASATADSFVDKIKGRAERGEITVSQALKEIKATRKSVGADVISGLKSSDLKRQTGFKYANDTIRKNNDDVKWGDGVQKVQFLDNLNVVGDRVAVEARTLPDILALKDHLIMEYNPLVNEARSGLGPEQSAIYADEKFQDVVTGYIGGQLVNNPEVLEKEFKDPKNQIEIFSKANIDLNILSKRITAAVNGKNFETNVKNLKDVNTVIKGAFGDSETTIEGLELIKNRLDEVGELTQGRKAILDNMALDILAKGEKLKAKSKVPTEFEKEAAEVRLGLVKDFNQVNRLEDDEGNPQGTLEAMNANNDVILRYRAAFEKGFVSKAEYINDVSVMEESMEAALSVEDTSVESSGAIVGAASAVFGGRTALKLADSFVNFASKYFSSFEHNPRTIGKRKIESLLKASGFKGESLELKQSELTRELSEELFIDERESGNTPTNESVQQAIDRVFKKEGLHIPEDSKTNFLDGTTGRVYKLIDGNFEMVA